MELIILVAILACPVVMGTAMLLMWREMRRGGHGSSSDEEPRQSQDAEARRA